jgi:hypothetical protein
LLLSSSVRLTTNGGSQGNGQGIVAHHGAGLAAAGA